MHATLFWGVVILAANFQSLVLGKRKSKSSSDSKEMSGNVCRFSALPALANGAVYGITPGVDIPVGSNVTYKCNSQYRVAPASPGTTDQLQTISCQECGTFSAFQKSCVYIHPSSCGDYYRRDKLCSTGSAANVIIDTDGPETTKSPVTVSCSITGAYVCTNVAVTIGTMTAVSTCPGISFLPVFSFTGAGGEPVRSCSMATVGYSMSNSQLNSLISSSNHCRQRVTIRCSSAHGYFTFIRRNGETVGRAYNSNPAGIVAADVSPAGALPDDVCDCQPMGSCGSPTSYCICSRPLALPAATGEDVITKVLTGSTNPPFVTEYGIAKKPEAVGPIPASVYSVTVGGVECCEAC